MSVDPLAHKFPGGPSVVPGVSTYSNTNATVANFSKQIGGIVQKASAFRTTEGSSWIQTFIKEFNVIRARRDIIELGFNIVAALAFPPQFLLSSKFISIDW